MERKFKNIIISVLAIVMMLIPLVSPVFSLVNASTVVNYGYYGEKLSGASKIFYDALDGMSRQGKLSSGESTTISNSTILNLAKDYSQGKGEILKAFGSAVDSFRFDHTELFFVDFDLLTVSVGQKGNSVIVQIGSGRADSYYTQGVTKNNVVSMVENYNTKLDQFVSTAVDGKTTTEEKIQAINLAITNTVEYSFCNEESEKEFAPMIRTAYGALINKKAVCEGYSRLFKACMDKIGVNCVLVQGYALSGNSVEPHMWNYVEIDSKWLGVDTTWNTSETNKQRYLLVDASVMGVEHYEEPVVSSSNYKMPYPTLSNYEFVSSDGKLLVDSKVIDGATQIKISYDSKGAEVLAKEGLYIVTRTITTNEGTEVYGSWTPLCYVDDLFGNLCENFDSYSLFYISSTDVHIKSCEFAVFDVAPNAIYSSTLKDYTAYDDTITDEDVVASTKTIQNIANDPNYIVPPYVQSTTPSNLRESTQELEDKFYEISITYTVKLKKNVESKDVGIDYTYTYKNRNAVDDKELRENVVIKDVSFDGDRTISFKFKPSQLYAHNGLCYVFMPTNLVGEDSNKVPNSASAIFQRQCVICSKVFNDGRYYMDVYGSPTLVGNSDLSLDGWTYTDTNGVEKQVSQNQRSQLALVVTTPNNSQDLIDRVEGNVPTNAVKKAETYELELNICGGVAKIPNGSYLRLSFGFPAGYGPEDEGVTFKVYHFKRNDITGELDYDNPEELDCVVTKLGLVVSVNSFSPYVVVALDKSKVETTKKGIALDFNGVGGTVDSGNNSSVSFVDKNGEISYTFTPSSSDYKLDFVLLNGKKQQVDENGKLTLTYDQLDSSNTLSVGFVSKRVYIEQENAGITNLETAFISNNLDDSLSQENKLALLIIVLSVVIMGCASFCIASFRRKNNKNK